VNGAIYIITQDRRYLDLVKTSAESLKRAMPGLPITAFSQFPVEGPFDQVILIAGTESVTQRMPGDIGFGTLKTADGFYDKARLMLQSPYQRTIFLDADIYVAEPFPELFTLLDHFDCAANHEEYVDTDWFHRYPCPEVPASFPEFNTGVMVYRRSAEMDRVFQLWCDLYRAYREQHPDLPVNDQPFFRQAIYSSNARIATLTREYNCKFRGQGYLNGPVKLLHGHVNFGMRSSYMQRVAATMNDSKGPRVYIANKVFALATVGRLVGRRTARKVGSFPDPVPFIVQRARRLKRILRERNIRDIVKKVVWAK
jgi:hypothetical protein